MDGQGAPGRRRVDVRSTAARHAVGRAMTVLSICGVVFALFGVIAGWMVTGDLHGQTRRSLDVTVQSLDSVDQTISTAETVLTTTTATLGEVGRTIDGVLTSFSATNDLAASVEDLATALGPALDDTTTTLRQLEAVGGEVDALLEDLSTLPLAPSYRPDPGLGPTFGQMASGLEPLAASVSDTAGALGEWQRSSDQLDQDLRALSATVADLNRDVAASGGLLTEYRSNVAAARDAATGARRDLDSNLVLLRSLVVAAAVFVAASQLVPWWLGRELLADAAG